MLQAVSFDQILSRAPAFGTSKNPTGQRLVSIVFAHPGSGIWRELSTNRAFLDERTGNAWDLFFAGMSGYGPMENEPRSTRLRSSSREMKMYYNPKCFSNIVRRVEQGHFESVRSSGDQTRSWRYSGGTDLVSFMAYAREPDWASLRAVDLDSYSVYEFGSTLTTTAEGLREWAHDDLDRGLAPGELPILTSTYPPLILKDALAWSGSAIVSGVMGNYVYDLLKGIFG